MSAPSLLDRLLEARRPVPFLIILCLLLWLPGFFTLPPTDRDEARFAQATRQMIESGDYVRIRLGEVERNKKPVGIHWAQAGTLHALEAIGVPARDHIAAYRVPSLLGGLIAVLVTYRLGRWLIGRRAAFLAAAMLAPTLILVVETHIAKTDAALLAATTIVMALMGRAYLSPERFRLRHVWAFWLALGLSILLKGPITPLLAVLAGFTLAIADRPPAAPWWRPYAPWLAALRSKLGVGLLLLITAPWFLAIAVATEGRFFAEALGGDLLGKVGRGQEAHWGPPGFYLALFGLIAFPSAWVVLRALPQAWAERMRPPQRFLLAWVVPSWVLFEAVATKLPHYVLPTFPALLLLAAHWAMDPLRREPPRWLSHLSDFALIGVALGLPLLAIAAIVGLEGELPPLAVLGILAGVAMIAAVRRAIQTRRFAQAALAGSVLAIPLYLAVLEGIVPRLQSLWLTPRLAAALATVAPDLPPAHFGIVGYHEPSAQFALGGAIRLLRNGAEAAAFLAAEERRVVAVAEQQRASLLAEAEQYGIRLRHYATIEGINAVRGQRITLSLFGVE